MKRTLKIITKFILSYGVTVSLAAVTGFSITGIDVMLPVVFLCAYIIFGKALNKIFGKNNRQRDNGNVIKRNIRDLYISLPVGIVFSSSVVAGYHFDIWSDIITPFGLIDILYFLFLAVFFCSCIFMFFSMIDSLSILKENNLAVKCTKLSKLSFGKKYSLITIFLIICWLPYYLTLFPGNLGKDTFESIDMCLGNIPWTNHHPIFFTMLINAVIKLTSFAGSIGVSIGIFTFIHMLLVAMTLGFAVMHIMYIHTEKDLQDSVCEKLGILSVIFFGLNPIIAMFSMYITKDVLFSCAVVMLVLKLYDMSYKTFTLKDFVLLGIWSLLTMLLRNNGIFMVSGLIILCTFIYWRNGKKILLSLFVPLIMFMLFKASAYKVLNIEKESFAESASIPLQQVGYVISVNQGRDFENEDGYADKETETDTDTDIWAGGEIDTDIWADEETGIDIWAGGETEQIKGLSNEEMLFLEKLMPLKKVAEVYTLGYTDTYKFDSAFDDKFLNENKGEFIKVWFKMLPSHFGEYVKAYLAQTAGYWHYGETNTLCTQGVWEDNGLGVERIDIPKKTIGFSLYGIIEKLMLFMRKAPLISIFTSMAMQFYAVLLLAFMYIRKYSFRTKRLITLVPLMLLWLSIMIASPAFCLFRYTYPIYLLIPFVIKEIMCLGVNND